MPLFLRTFYHFGLQFDGRDRSNPDCVWYYSSDTMKLPMKQGDFFEPFCSTLFSHLYAT